MVQISNEQLKVFQQATRADFQLRLATFMRTELPDETEHMSDAELLEFVETAQATSERHGVESEAGIAQYACMSLELGPHFGDEPEIADFLQAPGSEPEDQLDDLLELLTDVEYLQELIPYAIDAGDDEVLLGLRSELAKGREGE